mmetsp:Transcript_14723/g.37390  ORF Transcript_14723/g.37390 Transcript_14723/m.37390 type:complete len:461 (-) Transcript_14723:286-1668(-)|eukprot:jgi/Tetstr1/422125/TSEL_012981.t1
MGGARRATFTAVSRVASGGGAALTAGGYPQLSAQYRRTAGDASGSPSGTSLLGSQPAGGGTATAFGRAASSGAFLGGWGGRSLTSSSPLAGVFEQAQTAWGWGARQREPTPFELAKEEIDCVSERLRHSIVSDIPDLGKAANYYFKKGSEGKRMRPTMLMLMASSLEGSDGGGPLPGVDLRPPSAFPTELRRRQQRIAEVAEMIHVASLLHDDVIDAAATRRGLKSLNDAMGNKLAILAGDYLLARASVTLASLNEIEPVALMSQVIEHLVSGEIIQLRSTRGSSGGGFDLDKAKKEYDLKTFYKTASLPANGARSIAVLAGCEPRVCDLAQAYGRHLGMAFQITDDVLDFTSTASTLGKPALNDLKSGLTTAPVLYAAHEFPELLPMILRSYKSPGDVEQAVHYVNNSQGIQKSLAAAAREADLAAAAIDALPPAETEHAAVCRNALKTLAQLVLTRKK